MAKSEHRESVDPDIARLQAKSREGAKNVVHEVLKDPEVQNIIKNALLKETIKNAIILSCLLIGLLKLYDVAKTLVGFDWRGDLTISIILVLIGLIYVVKEMFTGKAHGD